MDKENLINSEEALSTRVLLPLLTASEREKLQTKLTEWSIARERARYEKLAELESEKQGLLRDLDATYDGIHENDNWMQEARRLGIKQGSREAQLHYDLADKLYTRQRHLQQTQIPEIDGEIDVLIREIEREEALEPSIRAKDLERLLIPLRENIESSRRKRRSAEAAVLIAKRREEEALRLAEEIEESHRLATEFWLSVQPKLDPEAIRLRSEKIQVNVESRNIPYVIHFTPIANIASIAQHGLLSTATLHKEDFDHLRTDHLRDDGWHDWISTSITFPNYKMLFRKKNDIPLNETRGWAILRIEPRVLWELNCKFMITNAANSSYWFYRGDEQSSVDSFELMFSHPEDRHSLPDCFTTDPQAEVMIEHTIPLEYISDVVVETESIAESLTGKIDKPISVERSYFAPRFDYETWKGGRRLQPHSGAHNAHIGAQF